MPGKMRRYQKKFGHDENAEIKILSSVAVIFFDEQCLLLLHCAVKMPIELHISEILQKLRPARRRDVSIQSVKHFRNDLVKALFRKFEAGKDFLLIDSFSV